MRGDRDEIKQALKDRIGELCARLLPDGRQQGRFWVAHNPVTGDAIDHPKDPTFKVPLNGDAGAWVDYRSGDKGDVIRLIEYTQRLDFRQAMDWAREFLGLRAMTARQRVDFRAEQEARRAQAAKAAEAKALEKRKAVLRLWDGAGSILDDTPAAALGRRYFAEGRGTPLDQIENLDRVTFRVHPALEWWRGATWERRGGRLCKVAPGPKFPAVVSGFRSPTGVVTAVHCTFLDPVEPRKAPVKEAKLMFGEAAGSVIAVSCGPTGLPHDTASEAGPLVLCEGTEDGTTLALGIPEARVWAAGSLLHMGKAPVWLPCVSAVFVAADNDWKSRTAQRQLDQVLAEIASHEKPVEVMRSAIGKDFNDGMTE
ncbi:DUF7146 domain-containing protein [Aureimonas sp. D3]|uniref:DUF7146 domain-containing protein n=1 Tax=Aureimonas sp. D3 TaxID=1638164 RepID=UPI0007861E0D|nr:hypothetical protein [Aureimonas sp. D3]